MIVLIVLIVIYLLVDAFASILFEDLAGKKGYSKKDLFGQFVFG